MARLRVDPQSVDNIFWRRKFFSDEEFFVDFVFECALGANLYEIQTSISQEDTPNYLNQRILHWKDEAEFFRLPLRLKRISLAASSILKCLLNGRYCEFKSTIPYSIRSVLVKP